MSWRSDDADMDYALDEEEWAPDLEEEEEEDEARAKKRTLANWIGIGAAIVAAVTVLALIIYFIVRYVRQNRQVALDNEWQKRRAQAPAFADAQFAETVRKMMHTPVVPVRSERVSAMATPEQRRKYPNLTPEEIGDTSLSEAQKETLNANRERYPYLTATEATNAATTDAAKLQLNDERRQRYPCLTPTEIVDATKTEEQRMKLNEAKRLLYKNLTPAEIIDPSKNAVEREILNEDRALCPWPNLIKTVVKQNATESNARHCYEPCEAGMDAVQLSPDTSQRPVETIKGNSTVQPASTEKDSDGNPLAYWACRRRCVEKPPGASETESVEVSTSCPREVRNRLNEAYIGRGGRQVKCPWIRDVWSGRKTSHDCRDPTNNYDCHEDQAQAYDENSIAKNGTVGNSVCLFDVQPFVPFEKGTGYKFVAAEPIACGEDYELIPVNRQAYFTRLSRRKEYDNDEANNLIWSDGTDIWGVLADKGAPNYRKMVGRRCIKQCEPGSEVIPTGQKEDMMCAAPCPAGTATIGAERQCVKMGYKQKILVANLEDPDKHTEAARMLRADFAASMARR